MKRSLLLVLCASIVAAFQGQPAASSAVSEDVPVPAGTAAVARALGLSTVPDRGRFVAELTRLLHDLPGRKGISVAAALERLKQSRSRELVPVPLTASIWSDAVFHRRVRPADLLFAILGDARAALVCHGLAALDDETLAYFAAHDSLVGKLHELGASPFGAFGGNLRVRGDRVLPPGGDAAIPLWEAVVGAQVSRPDRFIAALFTLEEGRIAYLYDTVAQLDPKQTAFVLSLSMKDPAARLERMRALAIAWSVSFDQWRAMQQPFARQPNDAAVILRRVRVDPGGEPSSPGSRAFWTQVFESGDLSEGSTSAAATAIDESPMDPAWLIATIGGDTRQRADRLDQLMFGQRVFASAPASGLPDVLVALRALPRYRTLMWTLERMGVRRPQVYAAAGRQAATLSSLGASRGVVAVAQFQGALALLQRMMMVGTLDPKKAGQLASDLIATPLNEDGRYGGAIVRWLDQKLRPAIPPADTFERSLIEALSGSSSRRSREIQWEGQPYRFDLAASERQRLERVREKQNSLSIDLPLGLGAAALRLEAARPEDAVWALARVKAALEALPAPSGYVDRDALPPGVDSRPDLRAGIAKVILELEKIVATQDLRRARRVSAELADIADDAVARALVSLNYALSIGDPEGSALKVGDVSFRHDFGFSARDPETGLRARWMLPRQSVSPGIAWHVDGSLLGLDVALARLGLRRLNTEPTREAPTLTSNEWESFATSVALMNAFGLDDKSRDAIVDAIEGGRRRISMLIGDPNGLEGIAEAIGMDGWRRRGVQWTIGHQPEDLWSWFSLGEMARLGNPTSGLDFPHWGMAAINTSGCLCLEMAPPGRWPALAGRPQLGVMASVVPDLNLHIARMLKQLALPAGLAKFVLSAAVQDFVDEVRPNDPDDWLTLVRTAQTVSRERIEDYVAAAVADGLLVLSEQGQSALSQTAPAGPQTTPPAGPQAPPSGPELTILSPLDNAYLTGPTTLRAQVDPVESVSAVIFFVDGRQTCVVTAPPFECEWDAGRSVAQHQIRVVATLVGGGRVVRTLQTNGLDVVENVDVDVVQVTVTVTDGHGRFVSRLPQSAFHVFEEDSPQAISHFESENVPLELVVAVDISGSMTPSMPKLKGAVKEFLGAVPSGNRITLLGFNDTVFTVTRPTLALAERMKAVDRLAPWGSTGLYDVVIRGTEMLGSQPGRKALVIFTDGEDQGSHATVADVERRLQASDVTLYIIGQGRAVEREALRAIMERLATPTGGRALFTDRIEELRGAFGDLLDELSNQYLLGYPRADERRDDSWRRIKVEVDGHREVRARQGYRVRGHK